MSPPGGAAAVPEPSTWAISISVSQVSAWPAIFARLRRFFLNDEAAFRAGEWLEDPERDARPARRRDAGDRAEITSTLGGSTHGGPPAITKRARIRRSAI